MSKLSLCRIKLMYRLIWVAIAATALLTGCNASSSKPQAATPQNSLVECYSNLEYIFEMYSNDPSFSNGGGRFLIKNDSCARQGDPTISSIYIDSNHIVTGWGHTIFTVQANSSNGTDYFRNHYSHDYATSDIPERLSLLINEIDESLNFISHYEKHTLYFGAFDHPDGSIIVPTIIVSKWNNTNFVEVSRTEVDIDDQSTWGALSNLSIYKQDYIQMIANQYEAK